MILSIHLFCFIGASLAARPFLNEVDTGIDDVLGNTTSGTLPDLSKMLGLPDFDWAARRAMNASSYTFYRQGSGSEWSYRNNLEVWDRFHFRPRVLVDITNIDATLSTSILGYNFSAPFFISPCAMAGLIHPEGERGLVQAAYQENILYIPSLASSLTMEQIAALKPTNDTQVLFQQVSLPASINVTQQVFKRIEQSGSKAIILTVDSASSRVSQRGFRYQSGSRSSKYLRITWDVLKDLQKLTTLPIIPKGIQTVEDARLAVEAGFPAIFLSNHGGRQLDGAPSTLEIALEIHNQAPEIFQQVEVYADGGVRYGTDALKLLALGVRAVGLGRPFMYANLWGAEGVSRAIQLMKWEIEVSAGNLGLADLKLIDSSFLQL